MIWLLEQLLLFVWMTKTNPEFQLIILLFFGVTFVIAGFGCYYIFKAIYDRYLHQQLMMCEIKHSVRLIETLYSERHEYQNSLQVMKNMAAIGATKELELYMANMIKKIMNTSGYTRIKDPVLTAAIMAYQAKAKEYNILVNVNCTTGLNNFVERAVKIGAVFNRCMDLLLENMTTVKGSGDEIQIDIQEEQGCYIFDFKTAGEVVFTNIKNLIDAKTTDKAEMLNKIAALETEIKELKGSFYPVIYNERILRLKLVIEK